MANNRTDNVVVIDMKRNSHERCIWNTTMWGHEGKQRYM